MPMLCAHTRLASAMMVAAMIARCAAFETDNHQTWPAMQYLQLILTQKKTVSYGSVLLSSNLITVWVLMLL